MITEQRTWLWYHLPLFWGGIAFGTTGWNVASSLIAVGLVRQLPNTLCRRLQNLTVFADMAIRIMFLHTRQHYRRGRSHVPCATWCSLSHWIVSTSSSCSAHAYNVCLQPSLSSICIRILWLILLHLPSIDDRTVLVRCTGLCPPPSLILLQVRHRNLLRRQPNLHLSNVHVR